MMTFRALVFMGCGIESSSIVIEVQLTVDELYECIDYLPGSNVATYNNCCPDDFEYLGVNSQGELICIWW